MLARAHEALGEPAEASAARDRAARLADAGDARTPVLSAIVLRLAEPAHPAGGRRVSYPATSVR
jgi:hypothetical protein